MYWEIPIHYHSNKDNFIMSQYNCVSNTNSAGYLCLCFTHKFILKCSVISSISFPSSLKWIELSTSGAMIVINYSLKIASAHIPSHSSPYYHFISQHPYTSILNLNIESTTAVQSTSCSHKDISKIPESPCYLCHPAHRIITEIMLLNKYFA